MNSVPDILYALSVPDSEAERRLHERLVRTAADAGFLDVAYRTLDTPIGSLLLAATDRGLVRVAFVSEGHEAVLQNIAERISPRILHAPIRLESIVRELDQYFAGRRTHFGVPLDFRLAKGFRREVLRCLPGIDYGRTASYSAVAVAAGSPKAVRAVGTACATNPLPVVVPCHRVIRSDGSIGQYVGGQEAKAALLTLEAVSGGRR